MGTCERENGRARGRAGARGRGRGVRVIVALSVVLMPVAGCLSERSEGIVDVNAVCSLPASTLRDGGTFVPIRGFDFLVDTLRVTAGTRVTWVNCEQPPGEAHTVTSDDGVWDSPLFGVGQTFSRVFNERGTFPYHCIPHPHMRAVIIVQ